MLMRYSQFLASLFVCSALAFGQANCAVVYKTTIDKKVADLTIKELADIKTCKELNLFPPEKGVMRALPMLQSDSPSDYNGYWVNGEGCVYLTPNIGWTAKLNCKAKPPETNAAQAKPVVTHVTPSPHSCIDLTSSYLRTHANGERDDYVAVADILDACSPL
jgi:hypothetical protein